MSVVASEMNAIQACDQEHTSTIKDRFVECLVGSYFIATRNIRIPHTIEMWSCLFTLKNILKLRRSSPFLETFFQSKWTKINVNPPWAWNLLCPLRLSLFYNVAMAQIVEIHPHRPQRLILQLQLSHCVKYHIIIDLLWLSNSNHGYTHDFEMCKHKYKTLYW